MESEPPMSDWRQATTTQDDRQPYDRQDRRAKWWLTFPYEVLTHDTCVFYKPVFSKFFAIKYSEECTRCSRACICIKKQYYFVKVVFFPGAAPSVDREHF